VPGAVQQELSFAEAADGVIDGGDIHIAGCRGHPFEESSFVAFSLKPPDHPRPRIRYGFVVQIDRVLCRQDHPDAKRASLLENGQDGIFRRRGRGGWNEAEHLIHVDEGSEVGRARLRSHPGDHLGQQQRHYELSFFVTQVGDRHDGTPGLALWGVEQALEVEIDAFDPARERGRGDQPVQFHCKLQPLVGREECVKFDDTKLADGRLLNLADQAGEVDVLAVVPGMGHEVRDENVFPAAEWVCIDPDQSED